MQQVTTAVRSLKPERRHLSADLLAGLTFAIVNVPQAMAHALLATVNPVLGIYTLMMAVPIGALFTSSVFMNVSTTSALSVAAGAGLEGIASGQKAQALVGVEPGVRDQLAKTGLLALVGEENIFMSTPRLGEAMNQAAAAAWLAGAADA